METLDFAMHMWCFYVFLKFGHYLNTLGTGNDGVLMPSFVGELSINGPFSIAICQITSGYIFFSWKFDQQQ